MARATRSTVSARTRPPAKTATPAAARPILQTKQELRERIEKLERSNVNLRAKNRAVTETSRLLADRLDALEEELGSLRQNPSTPAPAPAKPPRRRARAEPAGHDPGDAVPPGVAPQSPPDPDDETRAAKRALERNLRRR